MISGLLLVDKPTGKTSHDIVNQARRLLSEKSVGHTGTLDPLATGLLVLVIGETTKLSNVIMDGQKGYEVDILFGKETDSWDITGKIINEKTVSFSKEELQGKINQLTGEIELEVPSFSAVKVDGHKLYELAHKNKETPQVFRKMTFENIKLIEFFESKAKVEFTCSKGTYVRSWVQELGKRLGCGATVSGLRRFLSSPYNVRDAILLGQQSKEEILSSSSFISMEQVQPHWPRVYVSGFELGLVRNGQVPAKIQFDVLRAAHQAQSSYCFLNESESRKPLCFVEIDPQKKVIYKRGFVVDS